MTLTLYTDSRLPCPQRVHLAAAELFLELNIIPIDIVSKEHRTPEFTTVNRFNAIPVLVDTSTDPPFILTESRAICRYLAMLVDEPSSNGLLKLMPNRSDLKAVARFEEAASVEVTMFDPVANKLVFERVFKPFFGETPDDKSVEELNSKMEGVLDKLDRLLADRSFMAGDDFTLVDIFYMPYMYHLVRIHTKIFERRDNLKGWWVRLVDNSRHLDLLTQGQIAQ